MFGYIVRRLVAGVLVLIAVSMMVFALFFYGPNDPALAYCPESRCTPERLENISHNLGLDRPAPQQYVEYMSGLVKSRHIESGGISIDCNWPCLGVSFKYRVSVFDYLWERFPATLSVAVGGAICFLAIGLSSGIFAARRRGTAADKAIVSTSLFINAIPYYLLALLAYLYLVQGLGDLPRDRLLLAVRVRTSQVRRGHAAAVDHDRHRVLHPVRPLQPRGHDRLTQRGLRPHRARQGPGRTHGDRDGTPCARPSSRW